MLAGATPFYALNYCGWNVFLDRTQLKHHYHHHFYRSHYHYHNLLYFYILQKHHDHHHFYRSHHHYHNNCYILYVCINATTCGKTFLLNSAK